MAERKLILEQLEQVARGLGETFAPFCEVVVHDLTRPEHAILALHNNLSGRSVGDPATELGLARIADSEFPQVIANYANQFSDGRPVKSTSIGIRDSSGQYVAALCLNVDLSIFRGLQTVLEQFGQTGTSVGLRESLDSGGADGIRRRIDQFAARLSKSPRSLSTEERRKLIRGLAESGCLEVRRAMEIVSSYLGVSRATVYNDAK